MINTPIRYVYDLIYLFIKKNKMSKIKFKSFE